MSGIIDNQRFRKLLLAYPGKAVSLLYEKYYHSLVNISKKMTWDHEASEDIVQETFVHVWEKHQWLGQHHHASIEHYLVKVVRNKSISFYRRNIRLEEFLKSMNGAVATDESVETNLIEREMSKELRQIIALFPAREKECLLMKIDQEMTNEQIAGHLNISQKGVERSITSANKRLRRYWLSRL